MYAYINQESTSICEIQDDTHNQKVEIWQGEFNYILYSEVEEIPKLISEIIDWNKQTTAYNNKRVS
jgi:hypothetical protein